MCNIFLYVLIYFVKKSYTRWNMPHFFYHHFFLCRAHHKSTSEEFVSNFFFTKNILTKAPQCSSTFCGYWESQPTLIPSVPSLAPFSPLLYSHFLLVLLAAGQLALLVQEVDESHHQQEQQNAHHHGYNHPAGASLLLVSYSAMMEGGVESWWDGGGRIERRHDLQWQSTYFYCI